MKQKTLISLLTPLITLISNPLLLAQSLDIKDPASSYICRKNSDRVLVEVKTINIWKNVIEQDGWTCTTGTSDIPPNQLKFSCETKSDDTLGIVTVTWLEGEDQQQQMGRWTHTLSNDYSLFCSLAKTELWD